MDSKKSILIISPICESEIGGPNRFIDMFKKMYDIDKLVLCYNYNFSFDHFSKYFSNLFLIIKEIINNKALVIVQDTSPKSLSFILIGFVLNKRVVLRLPGDQPLEYLLSTNGKLVLLRWVKYLTKLLSLNLCLLFVKKIVLPSNSFTSSFIDKYGFSSKVITIYNFVTNPNFDFREKRKALAVGGRLVEYKNVYKFLELFNKANFILKNEFELYIFGDGPERIKIENYINFNNRSSTIKFFGKISEDAVSDILANSLLYVSLGRTDTFSFTSVTALLSGCGLLTNDSSIFSEISSNCKNHFVLNSFDELELVSLLKKCNMHYSSNKNEFCNISVQAGLKFSNLDSIKKYIEFI